MANTLYVGTADGSFATISDAVKAAVDGDIIIVKGGEYALTNESVIVDKAVTLQAEGTVVVDKFGVGAAKGTEQDITIQGFTFKPTANTVYPNNNTSGIYQTGTDLTNLTVTDCVFDLTGIASDSVGYGIFCTLNFPGIDNMTVTGCTFKGDGSGAEARSMGAIYSAYTSNVNFSGNTVSDFSGHAVQLSLTGKVYLYNENTNVKISDNTFTNIGANAIHAADIQNNNTAFEVSGNTMTDINVSDVHQYYGAIRFGSGYVRDLVITDNTITNGNVGIYQGVALKDGAEGSVNISGNKFTLVDRNDGNDTVAASALQVYDNVNGTISAGDAAGNEVLIAEPASNMLVDASIEGEAGSMVFVGGKAYVIGVNAFTTISAAAAAANAIDGKVTIEIAAGDYVEAKPVVLSKKTFTEDDKTYVGGITIKAAADAEVNITGQFWINSGATDIKDVAFDGLNIECVEKANGYYTPIGINANGSVNASGISVTNCTLTSVATGDGIGTEGVQFGWGVNVDGAVITGNTITADCGIYTEGATNANMTVSGNTIYGREEKSTNTNYAGWAGIYITNVKDGVVISDNTISDTAYVAIRTTNGGAVITDNTITNVKDERVVRLGDGTVISGNTVDGNDLAGLYEAYEGTDLTVCGGIAGKDGDTVVINGKTYTVGINAYSSFTNALSAVTDTTSKIEVIGSITEAGPAANTTITLNDDLTIAGGDITWTSLGGYVWFTKGENAAEDLAVTFDGVSFNGTEAKKAFYFGTDTVVDGNSALEFYNAKIMEGATVQVEAGSQLNVYRESLNIDGKLAVSGNADFKASEAELADRQVFIQYSQNINGEIELEDTLFASYQRIGLKGSGKVTADNSALEFGVGYDGVWHSNPIPNGYGDFNVSSADAVIELTNGSVLKASGNITNNGTILIDDSTFIANTHAVGNGTIPAANKSGVLTNNGTISVSGTSTLDIFSLTGTIDLADGAVVKDSTINGGTVALEGTAEFKGVNTVGTLNVGYYNHKLIVGTEGSLTATGTRTTLSYGSTIDVDGTIEDAKTADKASVTKSLDIKGGFSFNGDGTYDGQDATLDVDNAYVSFGSSTSKNSGATGNFVWNFDNSIVDFTADFQTAASTKDGLDPHFNLNITDSVFNVGSRFAFNHANSVAVVDNSVVTINQQFKNVGEFTLQNDSQMTVGGNADGPSYEKTGNFGTLNVTGEGSLFDMSSSTPAGYPFYNEGTVNVTDKAAFKADYVKNKGDVEIDGGAFTATKIINEGNFTIANTTFVSDDFDNTSGSVKLTGNVSADLAVTGNAVEINGANLSATDITGNAFVNGDSTISGDVTVSGKTKVANGSTLTIAEGANYSTAYGYLAAGNDKYFGFGENEGDAKGGTIDIYGNVKVYQTNADADGVINVKTGAVLDSAEFCVENGEISEAAAGVVNVDGTVKTASLRIFSGGAVNVSGEIIADHIDNVAALADINIWGGGSLNINGGTVSVAESMNVEADGKLVIDGGNFSVASTLFNKGDDSVEVNGDVVLNINKVDGKAIKVLDGTTVTDSKIGGRIDIVSGESTWQGTNTVTGIFSAGYNNYGVGDIAVNITGKFNNSNMLLWGGDYTSVVSIGAADAERTDFNGGQIGTFANSVLNITNADVDYSYMFLQGAANVSNSTLNIVGGTNTYFRLADAEDQVVVDNSIWNAGSYVCLGSYNAGVAGGYADVIIKGGSEFTAGNLALTTVEGTDYTVKLTVDGSTVNTSAVVNNSVAFNIGAGTEVFLNNGAKVNSTGVVSNAGTITIDATSTITAADIKGEGSIVIDAENFEGGYKKIIDITSTAGALADKVTVNGEGISVVHAADGDVYLTDVAVSDVYVNAAWADKKAGDVTDEGYIIGHNAFSALLDYKTTADTTTLNIAGGNYESIYNTTENVSVMKDGVTTVNASGDVVITVGCLVFETSAAGDVFVNGNYSTLDRADWDAELGDVAFYTGHIRFVGAEDTVFNIDGTFNAAENIQFLGGKAIISEDSVLSLASSNSGQYAIYDEVISYGAMSGLDTMQSNVLIINRGGSLTLSGEKASLTTAIQKPESWKSDIAVTNGALIVEDGAKVEAAGIVNVAAAGTVEINGAKFSAGTVNNKGTITVSGESTINIETLSGNYVRFEDTTLVGDSKIGGNIRVYGDIVLDGTLDVKQTNFYGAATIKKGSEFTGSTTIVGVGSEFTLEEGATLNTRFFNVMSNADINGTMNLTHSDPRQKLIQIFEGGVANINSTADVTVEGHNALVHEGGVLNVSGKLDITKREANKNDPTRGGILFNEGEVNVSEGTVNGVRIENAGAINVSNSTFAFTGDVTLGDYITIDGFTAVADSARDVIVAMVGVGESKGKTFNLSVAKNSTSATIYTQDFADGTYNATVIDSTTGDVFATTVTVTNGTMTVADSDFTAGTLNVGNGTLEISGNSKVTSAVTGAVSFTDDTVLGTGSVLTVDGDVTAAGDLSFDLGGLASAKTLSVEGTLSIDNVTLPGSGETVTLVSGVTDASCNGLVINGLTAIDSVIGVDQQIYKTIIDDTGIVLVNDTANYTAMSGDIAAVTQTADTYTFSVDVSAITGGFGAYTYSFAATDAAGNALDLTFDGTSFTLSEVPAAGVINVTATVTDEAGFTYTTNAFAADVADYTAPEFTKGPEATVKGSSVTITCSFTDVTGVTSYDIVFDGASYSFDAAGSDAKFTLNNIGEGKHTYTVTAYDAAGNKVTSEEQTVSISVAANIKSNGYSQIVAYDAGRGAIGYIYNDGETKPVWKGLWQWGADAADKAVAVGCFSGSTGKGDGILVYNSANQSLWAWTDLGASGYAYKSYGYLKDGFTVEGIADLDGNGYDDLLVSYEDGTFGASIDGAKYVQLGSGVEVIGGANFGTDNDSLIVKNGENYELWSVNGTVGEWSTSTLAAVEDDWTIAAIGDFSGDGIDDIVVWQESTGYMYAWENGDADTKRWVGALDQSGWEIAAVGDYNGDGKEDLLLRETTTGWGGLGYWGGAYAGDWNDLGARIETDRNGTKFSVLA
ncbi:MAG: hypothetical protein E7045_05005 [Lentisphaerae bacterium]|nr:hypothetical protein [Lentisphaerota bacterium]